MDAEASAAEAERARTGSARLEVVSLVFRIAEMEAAKAEGSLRFETRRLLGLEVSEAEELVSESELEAEEEAWVDVSRVCEGEAVGEISASEAGEASEEEEESAREMGAKSCDADDADDGEGEGLR